MNHPDDRREPAFGGNCDDPMKVPIAPSAATSPLGALHPLLDAHSLIYRLGLGNAIRVLRIRMAFPAEVFVLAAQPLIEAHCDFVQMLPISESGSLGQPGGQLSRAFATAIRALDRRRSQILPRGAPPEVIGAQAHRWTYAVFAAALLRDLRHASAGLHVWMQMGTGSPRVWSPAAGSLRSCGAQGYLFEALPEPLPEALPPGVASVRDDAAIALRLFERCVPATIQDWLREDPGLMDELRAHLGGQPDPVGILSELVASEVSTNPSAQAPMVDPAPRRRTETPGVEADAAPLSSAPAVAAAEFLEEVDTGESLHARQFMAWLRQGVLEGTLPVNAPDGKVHVVAEGLLLASPRIFQEFAKQRVVVLDAGSDVAKKVQRAVLREGWHLRADRGLNILCYERGRFDRGSNRVNGIVIREPQRFIQPLPGTGSTLVRVVDRADPSPAD